MSTTSLAGIRDLLPAIVEALPDAVAVVDQDRKTVAVNRRYAELFGDRRVDVTGSACTPERHAGESVPVGSAPCPVCEALASGASARRRFQVPDLQGVMHRLEATFSPIGADGVRHVVEVWRDVTDRSQLEVQLSHSERLASTGLLAAGVAHEINNPLASMLACAEMLDRWLDRSSFTPPDLADAKETVQLLEREIERCRDVTEKLMLLGRSYDTAPTWVDLNHAVRDTLQLLGYKLRRQEIAAETVLADDLPAIWAREAAIRGICMNLMLNAVQAMAGGGKLRVETRHDREHVWLSVTDTGHGIPPDLVDRIWDPFFTTKPVGQGTGLGLSITNRIVTRHGGRIAVESTPGRGARFEVELPIHGPGGDT